MNVNLAELEMSAAAIENLAANADKSYKSLFQMSRMIDLSCRGLLCGIYGYNAAGAEFPRYLLVPEWNECCSQFRSRLLIVSINDDYVVVPLKLNQIPNHPWWYDISFHPVSMLNSTESVIQVLEILSGYGVQSVIVGESERKDAVDGNYFNTADDFHSWMDKSKWRSKHGINRLLGLIEFRSEWYEGVEKDVSECAAQWNRQRTERGMKKLSVRSDAAFAKRRMTPFCYSFFCRGNIIGYSLPAVFDRCVALMSTKSIATSLDFCLGRYGLCSSDAALVHKRLGYYMQYRMHKDIFDNRRFDAIYYYGDVGVAGLKEFKRSIYRNQFYYNRYSIDCYIEMLNQRRAA